MTQIDYGRAAKYFLLQDFWVGMKLGLKLEISVSWLASLCCTDDFI